MNDNKVVNGVIVVALLALLALNGFLIYRSFTPMAQPSIFRESPLNTSQNTKQKTISVTGTGTVATRPDIAVIYVAVKTQADTASQAQSDNAAIMTSVLDALKRNGIAESDIETTSYTLEPITTYPDKETPKIAGYLCRNSIAVTVSVPGIGHCLLCSMDLLAKS